MEKMLMNIVEDYDKRSVKLISFSQPTSEFLLDNNLEYNGSIQDLVVYCARVSNPTNQNNMETSDRLVNYLIRNKHWSPFEMVNACIEINTTRDIARQILRHRSFAFQEFSQRYADPTQHLNFVYREARLQDNKNRQNSIDTDDTDLRLNWEYWQEEVINAAQKAYEWAMKNGIAKEVARAVLPEGLTSSRMYMNGSIRSWIHFIEVRTHESTQKEHRIIAENCARELARIMPEIVNFVFKK
jgi:thymidylate synthase (FAD)